MNKSNFNVVSNLQIKNAHIVIIKSVSDSDTSFFELFMGVDNSNEIFDELEKFKFEGSLESHKYISNKVYINFNKKLGERTALKELNDNIIENLEYFSK